jgi:hypothetical protein
VNDIK